MLISPQIEKDLFEGKCKFRTINFGFQTNYTIPVPKGSFIILRQIMYYQFAPAETGSSSKLDRVLCQISLNEKGKNNELVYIFKNFHQSNINPNNNFNTIDGDGMYNVETWQVYRNDVCIDLVWPPYDYQGKVQPVQKFNPDALEREVPNGYGTGVPGFAVPPLLLYPAQRFYQTGEKRTFAAQPFITPYKDRLRYDSKADSFYPAVDGNYGSGTQFPLITFGYFEYKTVADKLI